MRAPGLQGGSRVRRGRVTCHPGRGHVTAKPEVHGQCLLGSCGCHPGSGLNEPHWEYLGQPGLVLWVVGEGHVPPGAGSRDRQTCSGTACAILDYEGTILARGGPILARGLTSIIGSTWGCTGGSPGWWGRVTCAPGSRHVTAEPEVALPAPSLIDQAPSWLGAAPSCLGA